MSDSSMGSIERELLGSLESPEKNTTTEEFNSGDYSSSSDDLNDKVTEILNSYLFILDDLNMDGIINFVGSMLGFKGEIHEDKWNELHDIIIEYLTEEGNDRLEADAFGRRLDMVVDESDETIIYHSAHGAIKDHTFRNDRYGLLAENKNIQLKELNPQKKITILLKTKSMVGSTVLTSKTTETGVFGIDFKTKELEFSDYLKITISQSRIVMIELFNPQTLEWSVFYSEDIDRGKIFDIPNIEFTYGEKAFKTGILELVKEIDEDDPSDYVYTNMNANPYSDSIDWIPGPGLANNEEIGSANLYDGDDPENCLIHKILSLINYRSDKEITITVYNSTCLYNPNALRLIDLYPAWAYIYKDQILLEWGKLIKKLFDEISNLNFELDKLGKFKSSLEEWIEQRGKELQKPELIIYIRNNPEVKNFLGIEGLETYSEVELRNKTYEELFNIAKDIPEYPTVKPFADIITGIYNSHDERFSELTVNYNTVEYNIESGNKKILNNFKKINEIQNKIKRVKQLTGLAQTHQGITMYNPKLETFAEDLDGEKSSLRKKRTPQRYIPDISTKRSGIRKKRRTKKK